MSSSPPKSQALADIDVAVLAGGLGTRLRSVLPETPKILAPVDGRPFLDFLFDWLTGFGAKRVIMCLGYRADAVREHLSRRKSSAPEILTSTEPEPLGTAGALRLALPLLTSNPVLVMNGDTFVDADLAAFVANHRNRRNHRASILCATVPSTARYGRVDIDSESRVRRFAEKDPSDTGPGPINAGMYLFSQSWLADLALSTGPSLEKDVFADAPANSLRAYQAGEVSFIDFGTPESYAAASEIVARAARPAMSVQ